MKPNLKNLILIFGTAILLTSSLFSQRSDAWVQESWERRSGDIKNFQNQFPSENQNEVQQAAFNERGLNQSPVRQADHQSFQPVQPLPTDASVESEVVQAVDLNTGPVQWTEDIQGQLQKINWPKVLSSLAIVVGGYLGFVWLMRKSNPKMNGSLPSEVFELVGTKRMSAKQTLQLVRLGSKLLLLVHGEEGTHPIAEITDPDEVEYLTSVCNRRPTTRPRSASRPARATMAQESGFRSALDRAQREGDTTEAAMEKVIRKLSEMAGKASRTDFEA